LAARALRSILVLSLFAILTVLLVVPALLLVVGAMALSLTVLAYAIPLVLIAFVLWCPYLALTRDRRAAWLAFRTRVWGFGRWIVAVPLTACVRLGGWGIGVGRALAPKALPVARRARPPLPDPVRPEPVVAKRPRARPRLSGSVILEMIAGAAVGAILICLIDPSQPGLWLGLHILGGTVGGAVLGLLVGKAQMSLRPESS